MQKLVFYFKEVLYWLLYLCENTLEIVTFSRPNSFFSYPVLLSVPLRIKSSKYVILIHFLLFNYNSLLKVFFADSQLSFQYSLQLDAWNLLFSKALKGSHLCLISTFKEVYTKIYCRLSLTTLVQLLTRVWRRRWPGWALKALQAPLTSPETTF